MAILAAGPNWDRARSRRAQDKWTEHAAFMDALVAAGFIVLGGPMNDGRVVLIVEADSEDAIRARLSGDPWIPTGVLSIATIAQWEIWLGDRGRLAAGGTATSPPSRRAHLQ